MTSPPDLRALIRTVPDFPRPGVQFRDITTLLKDARGYRAVVDRLSAPWRGRRIDKVAGIESRGFLFGTPLAIALGVGFVPIRKPGKLPWKTNKIQYSLEYGTDAVEVHQDALQKGQKVLLVDDLLATGGTAHASIRLLEGLGAKVVGAVFAIELGFLEGRNKLTPVPVHALLRY